jgi:hypothetical protein
MPALTNICLSGCQSSQIFVYLNVNAQNSRSNNCSSGRWHKKAYFVNLDAGAHKCLLILDGDLAKFCLSGCRYAFSRFFAAHKYITKNLGSLACGNSAFKCETLHCTNTVFLYKVLHLDRKSPLAIYSPENYLAGGRTAPPEWDSGRSC